MGAKLIWRKNNMVYGEATVTFPLIAGYAYHKGSWRGRKTRNFGEIFSRFSTLKAEGYAEAKAGIPWASTHDGFHGKIGAFGSVGYPKHASLRFWRTCQRSDQFADAVRNFE